MLLAFPILLQQEAAASSLTTSYSVPEETTDASESRRKTDDSSTKRASSICTTDSTSILNNCLSIDSLEHQYFIRKALRLLQVRVLESERLVTMARVSRSRENPKRGRRNKQVVQPPLAVQGMVGLDSRDFFILPYCLSKMGFYDEFLLDKSIERLNPFIVSRLRVHPIEVFLAIEGFTFWASECSATGSLCRPDFANIVGPKMIPKRLIPHTSSKESSNKKPSATNIAKIESAAERLKTIKTDVVPRGEVEAATKAQTFSRIAERCATVGAEPKIDSGFLFHLLVLIFLHSLHHF